MVLEDLPDATLAGPRRQRMTKLTAVPFLIIDDLGMRKLPTPRRLAPGEPDEIITTTVSAPRPRWF
jgi:hypothetical protein